LKEKPRQHKVIRLSADVHTAPGHHGADPLQVESDRTRIGILQKRAKAIRRSPESVAGIKRVDAIAAGRVIGSADKEPYVIEWDTTPLAAGNHTLDVAVHAAYGNRLTKQVTVRVEGGPPPTPAPTPTPSPPPTPAAPPQRNPLDDILLGSLGFFAATALALVLVRRARRPKAASAWTQMPIASYACAENGGAASLSSQISFRRRGGCAPTLDTLH